MHKDHILTHFLLSFTTFRFLLLDLSAKEALRTSGWHVLYMF